MRKNTWIGLIFRGNRLLKLEGIHDVALQTSDTPEGKVCGGHQRRDGPKRLTTARLHSDPAEQKHHLKGPDLGEDWSCGGPN